MKKTEPALWGVDRKVCNDAAHPSDFPAAVTDPDIHHDAVDSDTRERSRELNRTIYYR